MKAPKTIPRSVTPDTCTDYRELLRRGLTCCQNLGGDLWTDYNEHDPGVTILEQLCFALTDLSYRTDFEVPDILAAPPGARQPEQTLYTGDRILTCDPLTPDDYRKLLYDRIQGLKNAWLVPITDHPLGIQGLYRVLVETREEIEEQSEIDAILLKVKQLMRSVRNLGEDVDEVRILKPQPIRVQATIEVAPNVDPANVLAQVLFEIQNSLIPFPRVQLVDQLFRTMPPDEIWNGPLLNHGALDQQSLQERKSVVQVEDIANIILQVPGVKRVKRLQAGTPPSTPSREPIPIKEDHVPRLDPPILKPQPGYAINIELEGGFKVLVNTRAVWSKIQELEAGMRKDIAYAAKSLEALSYLQVPAGKYRDIEDYFSIQHHFPAVYGLSNRGTPNDLVENGFLQRQSEALRQARVRQLKAYLLFFEQPLADYLAQLSHVAHLFSLDEDLRQSYFYQPLAHDPARPSEPPAIVEVLSQQVKGPRKTSAHYLVGVVGHRGEVVFLTRRQRNRSEAQQMRQEIIESWRSLQNYRIATMPSGQVQLTLHNQAGVFLALGQERFTSIEAGRAAAERWIRFVTSLEESQQELDEHIRIIRREDLALQIVDDRSRIVLTSSGILHTPQERERRVGDILASGIDARNYRIGPLARSGFNIDLCNPGGEVIARGEEVFATEFDAELGIDALVSLLRRVALEESEAVRDRHVRRLPEVEEIVRNPLRSYQEGLAHLVSETDHNYLRRRNRILDHLLARFSERFDDAILERLDLRSFGEKDAFYQELIHWKIEFLRAYIENDDAPALGAGRGRGFDYGAADESGAVSGLERRASLLLGMHGHASNDHYHVTPKTPSAPDYYYLEKRVRRLETGEADASQAARERIESPWLQGEPDLRDLHNNFVFSSGDSSVFRQLLAFGMDPENYEVQESGGTYHILFHPLHAEPAREIHHTHSRSEAEKAIAALIRYFQDVRQSVEHCYGGECLHVLEHVLLRPQQDTGQCCIHICDHESHLHLSSIPIARYQKEEHLDLILIHGQEVVNYKITLHTSGVYYLVLHAHERPIASGTRMFSSEQEAAAGIEEVAGLVRSLHRQPQERKAFLHTSLADDFYSHRISVLLPNWPMRFQNNEFKLYAEQLLYENVPAHLAVECFWLSVHEMQEFERLQRDWKALKRAAQLQEERPGQERTQDYVPALNEAADRLRAMIEMLQKKQEDAGPTGGGEERAGEP